MKFGYGLAVVALLGSTSLRAAEDTGLVLPNHGIMQRGSGMGITAGIKIKLGSDRAVKRSERVKLGIAAGPVFVFSDAKKASGLKRSEPSFVGLELKPGYSASLKMAGQPLIADYTVLGAAENDEEGDNDKQSTFDKVAWVAAVAGVVTVVGLAGLIIYVSDDDRCCE